jgi:hypothetical protein
VGATFFDSADEKWRRTLIRIIIFMTKKRTGDDLLDKANEAIAKYWMLRVRTIPGMDNSRDGQFPGWTIPGIQSLESQVCEKI